MTNLDVLKKVSEGNVVVLYETLYKGSSIFRQVNKDSKVFELLESFRENSTVFSEVDTKIVYDLYDCYIINFESFEGYNEIEVDFVNPKADYSNTELYYLHEGLWYKLEKE